MRIRRQIQEVGYCGPTCVSMLLESQGCHFSPQEIAEAAGVTDTIAKNGSRIDQLAAAVGILAPEFIILGMFNSDIDRLEILNRRFELAVGVEWQGRFLSDDGPFDIGHFSLITEVNKMDGYLNLVDPDGKSFYIDGKIKLEEFQARWWEDNELERGKKSRSAGLSFVIVKREVQQFLVNLQYEPVTFNFVRQSSVDL